jgi:hypothetical protein
MEEVSMRRLFAAGLASAAVLLSSASPASAGWCDIQQSSPGRTLYVGSVGPHPSFLSVDADPSGAVEVYYGYYQTGVNRPLLVGARADSSGARVYLVSDREGTVPEPDADLDLRAGTSPSACVAVPVADVYRRVP